MRAGFRAEAVGEAGVFEGQRGGVEDLVFLRAAQRDLGRGDEAQVAVFDRINLRFGPAGQKADPRKHFVPGQVGRGEEREAVGPQFLQRELHEAQLQQHGLVLEEVEAVAGDPGAGLEVDEVEPLHQLDVVEGLEIERWLFAPRADDAIGVVARPHGGFRMRHVGDFHRELAELDFECFERRLVLRDELPQLLAPLDERLPFSLSDDFGDLGRDFFLLVAVLVPLHDQLAPLTASSTSREDRR